MRSMILIGAVAALSLLAACSSSTSGQGGGGTGGQTSGSTTTGDQGCGGQPHFSVAGDVCVDGFGVCVGDTANPVPCVVDTDCNLGSGTVCRNCGGGRAFCTIGCLTDANCPGATCEAGGHCVPKACAAATDCPANFDCSPTESICVRKTCAADTECSGFCIAGRCSDKKASCVDCT